MNQAPIKLYWYRGKNPNFGDELSCDIVTAIAARKVERSTAVDCDMCAIGSILRWAIRPNKASRVQSGRPLHVWGSGLMTNINMPDLAFIKYHAVRGPLTKICLPTSLPKIALGDPGMLAPIVFPKAKYATSEIGFVPHWTQINSIKTKKFIAENPNVRLINPQHGTAEVINRISGCEFVLSSSLHGLIIADAYKIPNVWIEDSPVHEGNGLKFLDYFSSIGRYELHPSRTDEIRNIDLLRDAMDTQYFKNIDLAAKSLIASFPDSPTK